MNLSLEQLGQAVKTRYPDAYGKYGDFIVGASVANKYPTYQQHLAEGEAKRIPANLDKHIAALKSIFAGKNVDGSDAASGAPAKAPADYAKGAIPDPLKMVPNAGPIVNADEDTSALGAGGAAAVNMVPSGFNFLKGIAEMFNPVDIANKLTGIYNEFSDDVKAKGVGQTLKDFASNTLIPADLQGADDRGVAGILPDAFYQTLLPDFLKKLSSGDTQGAGLSIANDPVGQIAPLVLMARGIAEKAGVADHFDETMTKITKPIAKPVETVAKGAMNVAGKAVKGGLAIETGKGMASIDEAVKAGQEGGAAQKAFLDTLRGKKTPEQTAETANSALGKIIDQRDETYKGNLQKVKDNYRVTNLEPKQGKGVVMQSNASGETFQLSLQGLKSISTQALKDIGIENKGEVIDFSKRPSLDATSMQKVQSMIYGWDDFTPEGLNQLRQEIEGFRKGGMNLSPADNRFNHYIDSLTGGIRNYLGRVPEIGEMNKAYAESTGFLKEIKRDFSLGDSKALERGFKNLTTAMKTDNQFKLQLLDEVKQQTGIDLQKEIAGHNLSSFVPGGLIGRGADAALVLFKGMSAIFSPAAWIQILTTSPRIVGEMLNAFGVASRTAKGIVETMRVNAPKWEGQLGVPVGAGAVNQNNQQ